MVSRLVILPLFPYPTLFRSRPDARDGKERAEERTVPAYLGRIADVSGVKLAALVEIANESPYECRGGYADDIERDRKSTRLNSSHLVISYAVFCLTIND